MADQTNRGGEKLGSLDPAHSEEHRHTTGGAGRSDQDKQNDQRKNPDDSRRQPTDQTR